MNVKDVFTNCKLLKARYLILLVACVFLAIALRLIVVADEGFLKKQTNLAMRAIGDDLLRSGHDFQTPVPPIEQIDPETLRLKFAQPISIDPDDLLTISLKHISSHISLNSIVQVLDAETEEIVYGFEINHLENKDIPCIGRTLPSSTYYLDVSFHDQKATRYTASFPALSLAGVSLIFFTLFGLTFSKRSIPKLEESDLLELNGFHLNLELNQIISEGEIIQLTDKEMEILSILFEHEGSLVTREYLMNEVWIKKGVVTGRSLDMYISRLRKKIKNIPHVQVLNQHGKGYIFKLV
ncbi:winged helix-turn-helix domain-containing protein [Anditalea andensis]|uniref:OmpR/PhoB-type domain-containing protein n=1 Tax=Anditalea andensis TaxID=1048983 RepID=A0A074L228_9BACT|nr:winged helix-turn-helix domain-containing protein [Anditalea andensis]KEO75209.1 hypothetical protein EL17_05990 [Anditalea andensis]